MSIPLLLAPMAELSHRALRELIENFGGCDSYFSEMISSGSLLAGGPFEKWYIDTGSRPEKLVFQVVGSDSEQISRAAAILDRLGCAGIDINMGCSAPIIRKTGAGAAWMADIDRAGELISRVRPVVRRRLSVKLRIGYRDDFEYLVRFCRRLEAEGTELVTLHPRTVMEKFKRLARWEYVSALRQELKIPVAGNGDVACAEELIHRASSPCDAVMVGRAAIRRPWIFAQARALSPKANYVPDGAAMFSSTNSVPNLEETGLRFLELLSRYQPPEFHVSRAMRFFSFFCDNLKFGNYLKNQLNREKTLSGIEQVWRRYFIENEA
jgi:tRNA-dihydrouridine synthase